MKLICSDERCLFTNKNNNCEKSDYELVTRKVREGSGLWEKCKKCGLVINRTGVKPEDVENFYNSTYIKNNSYSKGDMVSAKDHFNARIGSIKVIADYLIPYLKKEMKVFELGAATGELLFLIKDYVNYVKANEINDLYSLFIKQELHIDSSSENYLSIIVDEKFDFIISINVIDHIYNTKEIVEKIYNDLNNKGYFYVEVPNDDQALKSYLPEPQRSQFKEFMYQKAHYYSFTFDTLKKLLEQTGFKIIDEVSRHDYTINNYLNWYYLGKPQAKLINATLDTDIHQGKSNFEVEMNQLFKEMNERFKKIISKNRVGETIGILCQKQ